MRLKRLLDHPLPFILLLAAAVRLIVLLGFPQVFAFEQTGAVHGSDAYDAYAQNLLATGVYGRTPGVPDAAIPPLYSYALAGVYDLFGRGHVQVGLFHIALDLFSIGCLFYAGKRLLGNKTVAALASLFYALYPYLIFQNLTLIDTPFFMALLYAFLLLVIQLRECPVFDRAAWGLATLAGLALGASILTRPITPPLALLVAVWFWFRLSLWQTVIRLLPVAAVSALVLVPWIVRNTAVYDAFVPMTTTSGANFWQGNSRYTVPVFRAGYDVQWTAPELESPDPYSREADAERFALGFRYLRENPDKIPELLWVKFLVYWSVDIAPRYNPQPGEQIDLDEDGAFIIRRVDANGQLLTFGENDPVNAYDEPLFDVLGRAVHRLYWGGLFLLGLAGGVLALRRWRETALLWLAQISMSLVYLAFHPSTRYRVPTDPLWFLFSAYMLVVLWNWWRGRRQHPALAAP
ncbi:MAG: glycosyltransferase family 39 protein [Chloroflexi bacterium]|nr:glycosyltransferase family 39 protein [Chloroflexota bacterium]